MELSKKHRLYFFITGLLVCLVYLQRPVLQRLGDDFLAYKQFDENFYIARVTQVECKNSPSGNCVANHELDKKIPIYPTYVEKFFSTLKGTLGLSIRQMLIFIYAMCPALIFYALYLFIRSFGLAHLPFSVPVLASSLLAYEVFSMKPLFVVRDFGYFLPFERFFNPLIITFPVMFFFAYLAKLYMNSQSSKKDIVLAGLWAGISYYSHAYYYTVVSLSLILFCALTFFYDRRKSKNIFISGVVTFMIGLPVIYHVFFGEKIAHYAEQVWTMGLLLPIINDSYLTHKGILFSIFLNIFFLLRVKKYKEIARFNLALQLLIYFLLNLPCIMGKILLIHHVKTFNVFTYLINYIILSDIMGERLKLNVFYQKVRRFLPPLALTAMFSFVFYYSYKDVTLHYSKSAYYEKINNMISMIKGKYSKKIFLAPKDGSDYILSNTDAQVYSSRFMNFCNINPEKLFVRNLLPFKIYYKEAPVLNRDCHYYWPWVGFRIEEFKTLKANCPGYNDYVAKNINELTPLAYSKDNNVGQIDYVLRDNAQFFNEEFLNQIYNLQMVDKSPYWTIYKVISYKQ